MMNPEEFTDKYYQERKGTSSMKWDYMADTFGEFDLIPLWVADMDFKVSKEITKAIQEVVDHGVYGYTGVSDDYYTVYKNWLSTHYNYTIESDWVRFQKGAVQSIHDLIQVYTQVDDSIIVLNPVYYPFHKAVKNTDRRLVEVDLLNNQGEFTIDFEAFEKAIIEEDVKLYIHCNPHNPVGRVWTQTELEQLFVILDRHNVLVISDEIHQDLVFTGKHIPAATIKEGKYADSIFTINSASKSFNIAGLTHSHIIIHSDELREKYDDYALVHQQATNNTIGMVATQAAFTGGQDWLDTIKSVVFENYEYVRDELIEAFPEIVISPLEGTYLLFIDLRKLVPAEEVEDFMQREAGIAVDYGEWFGEDFKGFVRFNLATKKENIEKAVEAMKVHLNQRNNK